MKHNLSSLSQNTHIVQIVLDRRFFSSIPVVSTTPVAASERPNHLNPTLRRFLREKRQSYTLPLTRIHFLFYPASCNYASIPRHSHPSFRFPVDRHTDIGISIVLSRNTLSLSLSPARPLFTVSEPSSLSSSLVVIYFYF